MKKKKLDKYKKEAKKDIGNDDLEIGEDNYLKPETKNSIFVITVFLLIVISIFSLFGWAGSLGKMINTSLSYLFGWGKYIFPVMLGLIAFVILNPRKYKLKLTNYLGFGLMILSYSGFIHLAGVPIDQATSAISEGNGGGAAGLLLSYIFIKAVGIWVAGIILVFLFVISILISFDITLRRVLESGNIFRGVTEKFRSFYYKIQNNMETTKNDAEDEDVDEEDDQEQVSEAEFNVKELGEKSTSSSEEAPLIVSKPEKETDQLNIFKKSKNSINKVDIPIDLLDSSSDKPTSGDIEANKDIIFNTLKSFGIDVEMGEIQIGPTVTQFTLKPLDGVKLSQIVTLNNDLSLALAAHPIRIEAPIPGKSLVGIEVPNKSIAVVKLKELLMSREFKKRKSNLTIALGKDVAGNSWLADLDSMPHLLVAGATGSGKSVCLNDILISLLYQNSPEQLKLILIDPKRVEMTAYNDIPHLITPVINQTDKTINALRWVVAEMDRRYELLSKTGHRNIQGFNNNSDEMMPFLVLAIDELADLMSTASKEVEAAIIRLAQMARAVGIHLILATQRPSVDIITGLIKANITTRIAFSVASLVDSRTILDTSGAEKLLGKGDMLYISPSLSKPKRLQGALVNDQEIERVLSYWKSKGQPEYIENITERVVDKTLSGNFEDLGDDELVEQAKDVVLKAGKASASLLQRRLRVGYARAARLLDILEDQGVIGPGEGAKPREILIVGEEEYNEEEHNGLPVDDEDADDSDDEDEEDEIEEESKKIE
ncbi:MAG: DNA translocase FtsK 4TM domain-containing protein [Candidatus Kerfeldbacteria bacterium]